MEAFRQVAIGRTTFHHHTTNDATWEYALHCHRRFEIFYFIKGDVSYLIEGKTYTPTPHSMMMFAPSTFHGVRVESDRDYERYALHFEMDLLRGEYAQVLLQPFYPQTGKRDIIFENCERYGIPEYLENVMNCAGYDPAYREMILKIRIEALLSQILVMSRAEADSTGDGRNPVVEKLIRYLNGNLGQPISLDLLSEHFFLSKNHLNSLFKQATGSTIMEYVIHKRIASAQTMILSGTPATAAAEQAGFRDYSSFFKAYKKVYGCSPSEKCSGNGMREGDGTSSRLIL